MIREKQVGQYTLRLNGNMVEISNDTNNLVGKVYVPFWTFDKEPVVDGSDGCFVRVHIAQAAVEFLRECLAEQEREKLSKFKCEVSFEFYPSACGQWCDVCVLGKKLGTVYRVTSGYIGVLPPAVVAAARKFAGWA